jgi:hypothetical protein
MYVGKNPNFNSITNNPLSADPVSPVEGMQFRSDGTVRSKGLWEYKNGVWVQIGSGSGSGAVSNYLSNGDGSAGTAGWTRYKNTTPGAIPEVTPGGTPTANLTLTSTTTSGEVLDGVNSFKLAKTGAVSVQGEGVYYDFIVPRGFASTPHFTSMIYQVTANYSYANNDVQIFMCDKTAGVIIPVTPNLFDGSGKFSGEWQTNANTSTAYRLYIHFATTSALNFDFIWDNAVVSASPIPTMISLGDKQYDLAALGLISGTNSWSTLRAVAIPYKTKEGVWRLKFNIVGSHSSVGNEDITISGVVFKNVATYYQAIAGFGNVDAYESYANPNGGMLSLYFNGNSTTSRVSGDCELESMPTWAVDYYPVQLGNGAETRIVSGKVTATATLASPNGTPTIFTVISNDSHSAYSATTGLYTIPISGDYFFIVSGFYNAGGAVCQYNVYKNGVNAGIIYTTNANGAGGSILKVTCIAGDTISIVQYGSATNLAYNAGSYAPTLDISRTPGPATIAASEKVFASYWLSADFTSSTTIPINFNSKSEDSHNAVTVSATAWKFTAPFSSIYTFSFGLIKGTAIGAGFMLYKNGVAFKYVADDNAGSGQYFASIHIHLLAYDYLDLRGNFAGGFLVGGNASENSNHASWVTIRN